MRRFEIGIVVALLFLPSPGVGQTVIPLRPWLGPLLGVRVAAGPDTLPFLFDTGGGVTVIDAALARRLGCDPTGRIGGFRSNGEWVAFGECEGPVLESAGQTLRSDVLAVWDLVGFLSAQLPEGFEVPPVGGVLSLPAFADRAITLDLANERVILESESSLSDRIAGGTPVPSRLATGEGHELNVMIGARAAGEWIWLKLDSGNVDRTLLDLHVAELLEIGGVPPPVAPDPDSGIREERTVALEIGELDPLELDVAFTPLTIDGLAGIDLIRRFVWTIDFPTGRVWAAPVEPDP